LLGFVERKRRQERGGRSGEERYGGKGIFCNIKNSETRG
jgi:hypothetical protein